MMSTAHDREHGHHHAPPDPRLETQHTPEQTRQLDERVHKLEALLVAEGLVAPETLEAFASTYENDIGPMNGARVVARAWTDPAYKQRLLTNATAAIGELGIGPVLGLPPTWYKMAPYRSRMVIDPRGVLQEFGLDLPDTVEVRVWDSSAEIRYMVLPERPQGTAQMSEQELAQLVTRDTMIGVARVEVTS